ICVIMEPGTNSFRVEFPNFSSTILQKLNQQRQQGQLCDISVVIQGHLFRAHKAVLAASSPYFCDQVLLKNSNRIVLPDVMNPRVFDNILLSCYIGKLVMPAPEIVSYLTAASFLQMWHVVDKCTELLEGNPTVLCQKSSQGSDHQSPSSSNFNGPGEGFDIGVQPEFCQIQMSRDDETEDDVKDDELSSPITEHENIPSNSSAEPDRFSAEMSQDGDEGESESTEYQYTRPLYSQPSIMPHKRWIQVKPEKFEQDYENIAVHHTCEDQVSDSENANSAEPSVQSSGIDGSFNVDAKKAGEEFAERHENHTYDEQVDYYGSSMEEFSNERAEANVNVQRHDSLIGSGYVDNVELATGIQEETSHSGFTAVVYKLYPCQCGKSFTHKSQRDRHMSMHLGLRPYGCVMWRDSFHRHVTSCTKAYHAAIASQAADVR
uniref:Zinc finger and BTB domain containing 43 n=1 Tax=Latimeria chalumnae TaxID=7897 RepID=H3B765_LATCH